MADVNRAMAPGWSIWTDQNDSLSQRDTGWIQLYCETNQEVLDTTILAFRLAEAVDLPVMLVLDAFFLSHTSEPVDIPDQETVDAFLPPRRARYKLDVDDPRAFGALTRPDVYMEMRLRQQEAMTQAVEAHDRFDQDWQARTGRKSSHPGGLSRRRRGAAAGDFRHHHLHGAPCGGYSAPGRPGRGPAEDEDVQAFPQRASAPGAGRGSPGGGAGSQYVPWPRRHLRRGVALGALRPGTLTPARHSRLCGGPGRS